MGRQKFVPGEVYHVWNRGVNRESIYFSRANKILFLELLRKYFIGDETATILAYCLMQNHYHLMVEPHITQFGLRVMQLFTVAFSKSINREQERVGSLFQGPFKANRVVGDAYLIGLSRYIHLNPVTARLVKRPDEWAFSSYREYVGVRNGSLPHPGRVLAKFESPAHYAAYVTDSADPRSGLPNDLLFE